MIENTDKIIRDTSYFYVKFKAYFIITAVDYYQGILNTIFPSFRICLLYFICKSTYQYIRATEYSNWHDLPLSPNLHPFNKTSLFSNDFLIYYYDHSNKPVLTVDS